MKIEQAHYHNGEWKINHSNSEFSPGKAQLVLVFGSACLVTKQETVMHVNYTYPNASIVYSSTAGEIIGDQVHDETIVVTAIEFVKTEIRPAVATIEELKDSKNLGNYLMQQLEADDLNCVFVISDGTHINGSELVEGLNEKNALNIPITGGLAGDGTKFSKTFVGLNDLPQEGVVVAIGFYGRSLKIGHGSFGGWDEFGPERTISRSTKNVLYEIDKRNALDLYKEYLGPYKDELPGSALLFPLLIKESNGDKTLVRTILSINEEEKSMLFAGNMPEGSKVRLMKANFDRLIEGSSIAAKNSFHTLSDESPELAIFISCVGRKIILQDRTDEEVEAAKNIFSGNPPIAGFYSYGEISPFNPSTKCELHNQTMTITTFSEI